MAKFLVATVLCFACGKSAPAKQDDWHRTPLKQLTARAGGIEFELAIPETWEARQPPDEGWGATTGDPAKRPFVTVQNVSADLASSLESAIHSAGAKPENLTRKEAKGEGYAIPRPWSPR